MYFTNEEEKARQEIGDGNYQRSAVTFLALIILRASANIVHAINNLPQRSRS